MHLYYDDTTRYVYPDEVKYFGITEKDVPIFVEDQLVKGVVSSRLKSESTKGKYLCFSIYKYFIFPLSSIFGFVFETRSLLSDFLSLIFTILHVLVCIHATRDKRCGRSGPQVIFFRQQNKH